MEEPGGYHDFDEDDLIDEYVKDGEGPPGDDDEYADMYEETMGGGGGGGAEKVPKPAAEKVPATMAAPGDAGAATAENLRGAMEAEEETAADAGGSGGDRPPLSVIDVGNNGATTATSVEGALGSNSRKERSLYGFERFCGGRDWRAGPAGPSYAGGSPAMAATKWKSRIDALQKDEENENGGSDDDEDDVDVVKDSRGGRSGGLGGARGAAPSAPDAQLVRYVASSSSSSRFFAGRSRSGGDNSFALDSPRYSLSSEQRLPVEGQSSLPVTAGDGTRVYVRRRTGRGEECPALAEEGGNGKGGGGGGGLLGRPMAELLRRAEILERRAERRRRARGGEKAGKRKDGRGDDEGAAEDKSEGGDAASTGADGAGDVSDGAEDEAQKIKITAESPRKPNDVKSSKEEQRRRYLWVDRHAPSHFSHLLSDERTNREVLRALRAWDPYVFKRDPPPRPTSAWPRGNSAAGGAPSAPREGAAEGVGATAATVESAAAKSRDVRPDDRSRVLLLSGPPGVGKTTLAHVVARHAGYRPLEVNASDERSAAALTERVTRAMESSTLNLRRKTGGKNGGGGGEDGGDGDVLAGRPNCLILDEIDGADARSAVSAIVEIIKADLPQKGGTGAGGTKSRGRKRPYLRRPIIFVCNHKHSPALRPLLPYARQFDVRPPSPHRLVARLRSVLASERLSATGGGSGMLYRLVGGTGGDVRSCLHALQFAAARARETAERRRRREEESGLGGRRGEGGSVDIGPALGAALGGGGRGMKDERSEVPDAVVSVFRKAKNGPAPGAGGKNGGAGKGTGDVQKILRAVEAVGDRSKTLDCLFLNVPRVPYVDPTLDRNHAAHEWLSFADVYRSHKTSAASNNSAEHHSVQRFHIPPAAAAVHLLCRVETARPASAMNGGGGGGGGGGLTFSTRELTDARYGAEANGGLLGRFADGLKPNARAGGVHGNAAVAALDVVPYCLWLLSAGGGDAGGGGRSTAAALDRAVSSVEVLSAEEREAFRGHVESLRALGLTYVRAEDDGTDIGTEGGEGGGYDEVAMRLEPEIDRVATFGGLEVGEAQRRRAVPSALKELLAHGVNLENMREREREAKKKAESGGIAQSPTRKEPRRKHATPDEEVAPLAPKDFSLEDVAKGRKVASNEKQPSKRRKLPSGGVAAPAAAARNFLGARAARAKAARTARRAATVGFDRSRNKRARLSHSGSGVPLDSVVKFKYRKGFTQAVRVPCRVDELVDL